MKPKILRVGVVQQACDDNRDHNLRTSETAIREAAASGAQLVLLQELHTGPYFCQYESTELFDLAEAIPGPSTEFLGGLARELGVVIIGSLFERRAPGLYHNTAVVLESDGSLAGIYRKMHIPDDPGYYEKFYFTPGDLGFEPIDTSVGRLGVLVCWDQWFPEAARLMALAGADLLLYPTAIGHAPHESEAQRRIQLEAWLTVQRAHAICNGVPVAGCNRIGFEPARPGSGEGIDFWGHSFIVGPQGEWLARARAGSEVLTATLDLSATEAVRREWPFLRDRRVDLYGNLLRRAATD